MEPSQPVTSPAPRKISVALDLRLLVALLLAVIAGILFMWKPWEARVPANAQTVQVTGEATVKAEPDEYVFMPNYEVESTDNAMALMEITTKSDEIVKQLKALGVADKNIKTNTGGHESYTRKVLPGAGMSNYTFSLAITLSDKALTQKVQDYLVTTSPTGSVSPYPSFSSAKRKTLESTARDEATKDARAKADQSAKNLGFSVSRVKTVVDGNGFGSIQPYDASTGVMSVEDSKAAAPSLAIQPGENELNYSVTVTYYIK